jgi:DNA-binding transcriptional MerR regulator
MAYRVSALAEMAQVTVRTLHHYDDVGLLKPSRRTQSGHRLYNDDDLFRLQQIRTLTHLGLSLAEVQDLLDSPAYNVTESLRVQKDALDRQIRQLQQVSDALSQVIGAVESLDTPDPNIISVILRGLTADKAAQDWVRGHFSSESWGKLRKAHEDYDAEAIAAGVQAWQAVGDAFIALQHLSPDHPEVQAVAAQMHDLIQQFTGGDAEIERDMAGMYADPDAVPAAFRMFDADLYAFMGEAYAIYQSNQTGDSES